MTEDNEKKLEARAARLEAEIERKMTPSEKQAAFATRADRRATDDDDREHPISPTTRVQVASATRRRR